MRCNQHIEDQSSSIGICASCLRERLCSLIESQADSQSITSDECRNSEACAFPRSVSPRSHCISEDCAKSASPKKNRFSLFSSIFKSRSGKSRSKSEDSSDRDASLQDFSADDSGCSESWKSPAVTAASLRRHRSGYNRSVSRLAFCLSPLVRANPSQQLRKKATMMPEFPRVCYRPHVSVAASLCVSRSRKVANFGRPPQNT